MNRKTISMLLLAAISLPVTADALRSVDKDGNVTFSDTPVPGSVKSEEISIDAPPPQGGYVADSQREAQAVIDRANRLPQRDTTSQAREAQGKTESRERLEKARKQLETAKIVGEGDRIGKVGGGTRLTSEYLERVRRAEQAVKEAEK